jgi:hypothetical protein
MEIEKAIKEFQKSGKDWSRYKDHEKREMAFRAGAAWAKTPTILPCLCGAIPAIMPTDPKKDGDAFGRVVCMNKGCPAQPQIDDGEKVNDERGSNEYKRLAIMRWNKWISGAMKEGDCEP